MIELKNVSKSINSFKILNNVDLQVKEGEFIVFFGPNGCGKTTLLNLVGGLDEVSEGSILINGKNPKDARIGYVFQNFHESVYPWLSVLDNVSLPLEIQSISKIEARRIATSFLNKVGLSNNVSQFPYTLSGGMKQRVAIARAMASNPDVLLFDEPFSALDYENRLKLEEQLANFWSNQKKTAFFVSHDIDEAVFLADKIIVMSKRPGTIKKIIEVDLPKPRDASVRFSKKFFELKNLVLNEFTNEVEAKVE